MSSPTLMVYGREIYEYLPWPFQEVISSVYNRYKNIRFQRLKTVANGMLSPDVYSAIYSHATNVSHDNMVEIGAGHGASTIALALAIADSGYESTVFTFEKGEGGSRSEYGGKRQNIDMIVEHVKKYDVDDYVTLIPDNAPGSADDIPQRVLDGAPFSYLCLDADGWLMRDFSVFYDLLRPGAVITIDDYSPYRDYQEPSKRYPEGGGKNYRTFCFTNYLIEKGYLHRHELIETTLFCTKPATDKKWDVPKSDIEMLKEHINNDRSRRQHS